MDEFQTIITPEDAANMLAKCGNMMCGIIIGWNFTSKLIPSENCRFGDYKWLPECDTLSVRIYLNGMKQTVEMVFKDVLICQYVSPCVFGATFDFNRRQKGSLLWKNEMDQQAGTFVQAYEMKWRIVDGM